MASDATASQKPSSGGSAFRDPSCAPQSVAVAHMADRERQRIAAHLHDTTVQDLVAARIMLDLAREKGCSGELSAVTTLLDAGLRQLRSLVVELSPPPLAGRDLFTAIEVLSRQLSDRWRISYSCDLSGEPVRLPEPFANLLLSASRELITNVGRHAHARGFDLTLCYEPSVVMLTVRDDGCGLRGNGPGGVSDTAGHRALEGGFGLRSLRARAMDLGGQLALYPAKNGGTVATVSLYAPPTKPPKA